MEHRQPTPEEMQAARDRAMALQRKLRAREEERRRRIEASLTTPRRLPVRVRLTKLITANDG